MKVPPRVTIRTAVDPDTRVNCPGDKAGTKMKRGPTLEGNQGSFPLGFLLQRSFLFNLAICAVINIPQTNASFSFSVIQT